MGWTNHRVARTAICAGLLVTLTGCGGPTTYTADDVNLGDAESTLENLDTGGMDPGDGSTGTAFEYLHDRRWDAEGFAALAAAVDAAATDPEVLRSPSSDDADRAALLAARAFSYIGDRDDVDELPGRLREDDAGGAAESLAHILSTYPAAIDIAPSSTGDDPASTIDFRPLGYADRDTAPTPYAAGSRLAAYTTASISTDAGLAELRAGLTAYEARRLVVAADHLPRDGNFHHLFEGVLDDCAAIEAFVVARIRDDPTRDAAERNDRITAWLAESSDIATAIGRVRPGRALLSRDGTAYTLNQVRRVGEDTDGMDAALADGTDGRLDDLTLDESNLLRREWLVAETFERSGLWADAGALDLARPGGDLISWDAFAALPEHERAQIRNQVFSAAGTGTLFDADDSKRRWEENHAERFRLAAD